MRGQDLVHVEVTRPGQRVEVVPERVRRRGPLPGDVRGDPGQHVVAGEQSAEPLVHEAQVPRVWPGVCTARSFQPGTSASSPSVSSRSASAMVAAPMDSRPVSSDRHDCSLPPPASISTRPGPVPKA